MKKTIGFDIGAYTVHAAVNAGGVTQVVNAHAPDGLVREGHILSFEAMSEFLRELRKAEKLRVKDAAMVLPASECYCRRFTTAYMSAEQLKFNLPYEFRDFIAGEKEDYFYDYAVVDVLYDQESGEPKELDLMASAVKKKLTEDLAAMFRHAGFKLTALMPEELAYINLLRLGGDIHHCHCLLDLGYTAVKLFIFNGDRFENVRVMDFGCASLVRAVADHFGVDEHVAAAYIESDYNGCTRLPQCVDIYNAIAVEVTKAANFYRFNSGGGEITHVHLGGGGAKIAAMRDILRQVMTLGTEDMGEFFPRLSEDAVLEASAAAAAVGASIQ